MTTKEDTPEIRTFRYGLDKDLRRLDTPEWNMYGSDETPEAMSIDQVRATLAKGVDRLPLRKRVLRIATVGVVGLTGVGLLGTIFVASEKGANSARQTAEKCVGDVLGDESVVFPENYDGTRVLVGQEELVAERVCDLMGNDPAAAKANLAGVPAGTERPVVDTVLE